MSDLDTLRAAGWSVAVHNDYRLHGEPHTFWLFTHPDGRWIKGEGRTDEEAIRSAVNSTATTAFVVTSPTVLISAGSVLNYIAAVDALDAPVPRMPGEEYHAEMRRQRGVVASARSALDAELIQAAAPGGLKKAAQAIQRIKDRCDDRAAHLLILDECDRALGALTDLAAMLAQSAASGGE